MKILFNHLIPRECHCWFLSSLDIDYDDDVTRSHSWEPTEKQNLNMGLHGRSLCWTRHRNMFDFFTGINELFVDMVWLELSE